MTTSDACRVEIQKIDEQVKALEKEKQKHQDLARQYQQKGDNWQYYSSDVQNGYNAWDKADDEQRKAIDIQAQIDVLIDQKQRIMQFYPELWEP
jgi:predicted ribosome quality control (RQC) complex YloA/Tae2 family protein